MAQTESGLEHSNMPIREHRVSFWARGFRPGSATLADLQNNTQLKGMARFLGIRVLLFQD